MTTRPRRPRFVVCVDNTDFDVSLELHKIYRVLPDEDAEKDGALRVVDESGEDYLYSRDRFIRIEVSPALEKLLMRVHSFGGPSGL